MEEKDVLAVHRVLKGMVGDSVTFGTDASYWYDMDLQEIGEIRATVVISGMGNIINIKLTGAGIDAAWSPFGESIRGKGSKKFTNELAQVGRDAVAWFTRELDSTEQPEPADMIEEDGRASAAAEAAEWLEATAEEPGSGVDRSGDQVMNIPCPHCGTAVQFIKYDSWRKECESCGERLHFVSGGLLHSAPKNTGKLTKTELVRLANGLTTHLSDNLRGGYLQDPDYREFADLDGTEARRYLESKGFIVKRNWDTGRNGYALTECGIRLSTNGFLGRVR